MNTATAKVDPWPEERAGYSGRFVIAYAPAPKASYSTYPTSIKTEERLGSFVAGIGLILVAQAATHDFAGITRIGVLPPGPLETCAIGVLIWLHGKWRRATHR